MENQKNVSLSAEADQFLLVKTAEFNAALYKWDQFFKEVSQKVYDLAVSGVSTSSGWDSSNSRNYNVDINIDMSAAEKYLESIKDEIPQRAQAVYSVLDSIDFKLDYFSRMGLSDGSFDNLVQYFLNCADRCQNLECNIRGNTKKMDLPGKYLDMKRKWSAAARYPAQVTQFEEVNILGVSARSEEEKQNLFQIRVNEVMQKRKDAVEQERFRLKKNDADELEAIRSRFMADSGKLEREKHEKETELSEKKEALQNIGFFRCMGKKQLQKEIEGLEAEVAILKQKLNRLMDCMELEKTRIEKKQQMELDKKRKEIYEAYPYPENAPSFSDIPKYRVLNRMEVGQRYTISQIMDMVGFAEYTSQKTTQLVRVLINLGFLVREADGDTAYFRIV